MATVLLQGGSEDVYELLDAAEELGPGLRPQVECRRVLLRSFEPWAGEEGEAPFQLCSRLLSPGAELAASFIRLPVTAAINLRKCGYSVVDEFFDPARCAEVPGAVRASLSAWLQSSAGQDAEGGGGRLVAGGDGETWERRAGGERWGGTEGLSWSSPKPRADRADHVAALCADDPIVSEEPLLSVVSAFQELLVDLQAFVSLRGGVEMQLAWYPAGSSGYRRHTDARPDGGTLSGQRRITAIAYCNDAWRPEDGGELRLWPEGLGGDSVDVLPQAGRLLLFLSGCIPHAVRPTHRDRVALTMWVR